MLTGHYVVVPLEVPIPVHRITAVQGAVVIDIVQAEKKFMLQGRNAIKFDKKENLKNRRI